MYKRGRDPLSPDSKKEVKRTQMGEEQQLLHGLPEEVGKMTTKQLFLTMSQLLDMKLESKASKSDLQRVESDVEILKTENIELKREIGEMAKEINGIKKTQAIWEDQRRKTNLMVRGMIVPVEKQVGKVFEEVCLHILRMEAPPKVEDAYKIGGQDNLFLVRLASFDMVINVLKKSNLLKNTGIVIYKDLSIQTREIRKALVLSKKEILKSDPNIKIAIRDRSMLINNVSFAWSLEEGITTDREDNITTLEATLKRKISEISDHVRREIQKTTRRK